MVTSTRRLAAIMFTDIVGYAARVGADEAGALRALEQHNALLRPCFARYRGREVKTVGDAFLVEFDSALDAVTCAAEMQRTLRELGRSGAPDGRVEIRIGIHAGDVVEKDGDILGDAVNIASRIQALADPGGICVSQQIFDQVENKTELRFDRLPAVPLKNIRSAPAVYRVIPPENAPLIAVPPEAVSGRHLAVLPLANISPDPNDAYFADGLTEELISTLSQVNGLSVIARSSVVPYKTAAKSISLIGSELGVDSVLEGSVRKAGKRIRITLQLIDAATQRHIWASSYNREVEDVFAVQEDIAERTAAALRLELTHGARDEGRRRPTPNPAAYEAYLRGLVAGSDLSTRSFEEAAHHFEEATRLDPMFAEAFSAWANLYVCAAGDYVAVRSVMPRARELAQRALTLDPGSSDVHAALGNIALQFDHEWDRAEAEFARAIELNPSNATAYRFLGMLLMARDRFPEARTAFQRSIELDPAGQSNGNLAWAEVAAGRPEVGLAYLADLVATEPDVDAHRSYLGFLLLEVGRRDEARAIADRPPVHPTETNGFDWALLNALLGRPDDARRTIELIEGGRATSYVSAAHLAMLYAAIGKPDRALTLLEQDTHEGDGILWLFRRGIFFDSLRDAPRFVALLQELKLPTDPVRGRGGSPPGPT